MPSDGDFTRLNWRARESPEGTDGTTSAASFTCLASLDSSCMSKQRRKTTSSITTCTATAHPPCTVRTLSHVTSRRCSLTGRAGSSPPARHAVPAHAIPAAAAAYDGAARVLRVPPPSHACRTGACQQPDAQPDRTPGPIPATSVPSQGVDSRVPPRPRQYSSVPFALFSGLAGHGAAGVLSVFGRLN